jgi:hypothetical protein
MFSSMYVTPSVNKGAAPAPCSNWATKKNHTFHDKFSISGVLLFGSAEHPFKNNNKK